jgi:hypothetical protein
MPSPTSSPHTSKALAMHSAPDHDHGSTSCCSPPGPLRARTWSRLISSWLRVTKVSSKPQIAGLAWHLAQRGARAAMLCLRALGMASQKFQLHSKQWATLGCSRYSACNIEALIVCCFVYKYGRNPLLLFSSPVTHFTSIPKFITSSPGDSFNVHLIQSPFILGI